MTMNRYKESRPCPKCGFTRIDDIHSSALVQKDGSPWPDDIIVRHCLRCKFSWDELPLDRTQQPPRSPDTMTPGERQKKEGWSNLPPTKSQIRGSA